jgi:hypothetical protein
VLSASVELSHVDYQRKRRATIQYNVYIYFDPKNGDHMDICHYDRRNRYRAHCSYHIFHHMCFAISNHWLFRLSLMSSVITGLERYRYAIPLCMYSNAIPARGYFPGGTIDWYSYIVLPSKERIVTGYD